MDWLGFTLLVLYLFALITVPGALVVSLGLSQKSNQALWLLSPVLGLGLIGLLSALSIPFGHWSVVYVLCLVVGLAGLLYLRRRTGHALDSPKIHFGAGRHATVTYSLIGVVLFFLIYAPAMLQYWTGPGSPQSWGDAAFHTQGILLVVESGNVNPFEVMGEIIDPITRPPTYYPTLWHALSALALPYASVAEAHNALTVLIGLVVWPLTLSGATVMITRQPTAALWAPLFAVLAPIYPGVILFANAMSPFGLSLPMVPAAVAVLTVWVRPEEERDVNRSALTAYIVLLLAGAAAAQPSSAVLIVIAIGVAALAWWADWLIALAKSGRRLVAGGGAAGTAFVIFFAVLVVGNLPLIKRLGTFERDSVNFNGVAGRFLKAIGSTGSYSPGLIIVLLAGLGVVLALRTLSGRVAVGVYSSFFIIYAIASGPDGLLRDITGIWYKDHTRLGLVALVGAITFGAAGTAWVLDQLKKRLHWSRRGERVAIAFTLVFFFAASEVHLGGSPGDVGSHVRKGYYLGDDGINMLDLDKAELLSHVDDSFPPGTYIIGPPSTGVEFVAQMSHSKNFLTLNPPRTSEQITLAQDIDEILINPEICELLEEANIEGLVTNSASPDQLEYDGYSGLFDVDTDEGFELVASVGDYSLWKITACD